MPPALLIRTDAGPKIGMGHFMRCLALAQAWQSSGGEVHFAMQTPSSMVVDRLQREKMVLYPLRQASKRETPADAVETADLAREVGAEWIIVDGYHFADDYQRHIHRSGLWQLTLDDYGHATHYYADLILNQNAHANAEMYARREPYTGLLLGLDYTLLRREFSEWQGRHPNIPDRAAHLLVTLGGSDPRNQTLPILQALRRADFRDLDIIVVAGGSNPHIESLAKVVNQTNNIRLIHNAQDMPALMAWADLAVSAAGSTCWELAFMGVPIITIVLADNQRQIADSLARLGCATNLGWYEEVDVGQIVHSVAELVDNQATRTQQIRRGQALVDGHGAERVVARLRQTETSV